MTDKEFLEEYFRTICFWPMNWCKTLAHGSTAIYWLRYAGLMETWEICYKSSKDKDDEAISFTV